MSSANTAETLGKQHGVTGRTIRRDGKRAEAIEKLAETRPEAAPRMLFGVNQVKSLALTPFTGPHPSLDNADNVSNKEKLALTPFTGPHPSRCGRGKRVT